MEVDDTIDHVWSSGRSKTELENGSIGRKEGTLYMLCRLEKKYGYLHLIFQVLYIRVSS
jgi:hypothetical protein